ncbi:E3 ubiquitin-protein ligase TRIM39 [Pelomyxa schiedti]|nr:E3 ubiquitin-protein ligase TRIM39 [Pelomyxa schiedti]
MSFMDAGEDPDLALKVPVRPLYEEFVCPICFSLMKDVYTTPCGHDFCATCIKECLNRKHNCPCCNKATEPASIIKNHHLDRLISIVSLEKDKASKEYFESLISKAESGGIPPPSVTTSTTSSTTSTPSATKALSPIEEICHTHVKRCLAAYQEYYQDLLKKKNEKQEALKAEFAKKLASVHSLYEGLLNNPSLQGSREATRAQQELAVKGVTQQCEEQISKIQAEFDNAVQLLLEGYNQYMSEFAPDPSFVPVSVCLSIPSHKISFPKVTLRPTDCMHDMKRILTDLLDKKGNPVVTFPDTCIFVIKRSLDSSAAPPLLTASATSTPTSTTEEAMEPTKAVHRYRIIPGTEIMLTGPIQLKSDQPQQCFAAIFQKGKNFTMDYYTCADCKLNWICKPCAEHCHKTHKVTPYITNHVATWACCYCMKNNKCTLTPKRS